MLICCQCRRSLNKVCSCLVKRRLLQTSFVANNVNPSTLRGKSKPVVTAAEAKFYRNVPLQDLQRYYAVYKAVRLKNIIALVSKSF